MAEVWEPLFYEAAVTLFEDQKQEILAIVQDEYKSAIRRKASIHWTGIPYKWEELFTQAGDKWRSTFVPLVSGVAIDTQNKYVQKFGMRFDVTDLGAARWYDEYTLTFATDINANTKTQLSAVLQQAQLEGWSIPEMQKNISTLFEQWMTGKVSPERFEWYKDRLPPHRTEMIARTETIGASNVGAHRLMKKWGAKYKAWLATGDKRTRPTHELAWLTYDLGGTIGPIPMDEHFTVGGAKMLYPGDKSAPVEEIVNCRCTTLAYWPEELGDKVPVKPGSDVPAPVITDPTGKPPLTPKPPPAVVQQQINDTGGDGRTWVTDAQIRAYVNEWDKYLDGLSVEQRDALNIYTGGSYSEINKHLRGKLGYDPSVKTKTVIKHIDQAFQPSSGGGARENMTVWRGVEFADLFGKELEMLIREEAKKDNQTTLFTLIGKTKTDEGYHSTTIDRNVAAGWGGNMLVEMFIPKGTPGAYVERISNFQHEREFLLGRGITFVITDIQHENSPAFGRGKYFHVKMKVQ